MKALVLFIVFGLLAGVSFTRGTEDEDRGGTVSQEALNALYALYNSTSGDDWLWGDVREEGPIWDFTTNSSSFSSPAPCRRGFVWQGLNCSCLSSDDNNNNNNNNGTVCTIVHLSLQAYNLQGSLPPEISHLRRLEYLCLDENFLTGPIPPLDTLIDLKSLYLDGNYFSSTIPSLEHLVRLEHLFLNNNMLSGPIPLLDPLSRIEVLSLDTNAITGTIPKLDNLGKLSQLFLYTNEVEGTIPSLLNLRQLTQMHFDDNRITGVLPSLDGITQIQYFDVDSNLLSGSIPNLDYLGQLRALSLWNNALTGSLPTLKNSPFLGSLLLEGNQLVGQLDGIFDPTSQLQLNTIQLSSNNFHGTIPSEIFDLPSLAIFIIVENCMQGPLPIRSICNSSSIQSLLLDGLHTASSCRTQLLGGLIKGLYELDSNSLQLADQLDSCLFSIPTLNTFHMSGNGLVGGIPDIPHNSNITDLVLSHNALSGSIPLSIQKHTQWTTLDLSYNRLSGVLSPDFTPSFERENRSISLELNRISGDIPKTLSGATDISILSGNIFSCNYKGTSLPAQDNQHSDYSCGSDSFNIPYYIWLLVVTSAFSVLFVRARINSNSNSNSNSKQPMTKNKKNKMSAPPPPRHNGTAAESREQQQQQQQREVPTHTIITNEEFDDAFTHSPNLVGWLRVKCDYFVPTRSISCDDNSENESDMKDRNSSTSPSPLSPSPSPLSLSLQNLQAKRLHDYLPAAVSVAARESTSRYSDSSTSRSSSTCSSGSIQLHVFMHIQALDTLFSAVCRLGINCGLYIVIVLVPLYIICGLLSSTYTNRYAWMVSTSFMSGSVTTGLFFCALTVYVCFLVLQYNTLVLPSLPAAVRRASRAYSTTTSRSSGDGDDHTTRGISTSSSSSTTTTTTTSDIEKVAAETSSLSARLVSTSCHIFRTKLPWVGVIFINVMVVGLANVGFVWVSVYHGSRWNLFGVQIALALVKYLWSRRGIRWLILSLFSFVTNAQSSSVVTYWTATLELYLAVLNNIVLPCFVVVLVEPDCFFNFLVPIKDVGSSYVYSDYSCDNNECLSVPVIGRTSFDPPFIYSYQCSASFTTHYATAFLFLCVVTGILVPLWELLLMHLYSKELKLNKYNKGLFIQKTGSVTDTTISALLRIEAGRREEYTTNNNTTTSSASSTTEPIVAPALPPPPPLPPAPHELCYATSDMKVMMINSSSSSSSMVQDTLHHNHNNEQLCRFLSSKFVSRLLTPVPLILSPPSVNSNSNGNSNGNGNGRAASSTKTKTEFFHSNQHLTTIVVLLALLFTFGTVFPLLGVVVIATLVIYCYFTQFKLARFISLSRRAGLTRQLRQIDEDCSAFVIPSERWVWWMLTISCWLYSFVLFDTLGDAAGLTKAIWVSCAMALLPLLIYISDRLFIPLWYKNQRFLHNDPQQVKTPTNGSPSNYSTDGIEMGQMEEQTELSSC